MGVNNLAWNDAIAVMAHYFSDEEILAGWTESFTTKQIAMLQRHPKRIAIEPIKLCIALFNKLSSDCRLGAIPAALQETPKTVKTPFFAEFNSSTLTAKEAYLLGEAKGKKLADQLKSFVKPGPTIETYRVTAHDFKDWLKLQREMPSTHVQAWFDAVVPLDQNASDVLATTASAVKPVKHSATNNAAVHATVRTTGVETKEARQKRRYDLCIAAGLRMPKDNYSYLPNGIGALARAENISTAAFSKDVKAYIASNERR